MSSFLKCLYSVTILVSAFLLFQIQPLAGKIILPWFGGASSVWTVCMLFFQGILLMGYIYSHTLATCFRPKIQAFIHTILLLSCLFCLPIQASSYWQPQGNENPLWQILGLLFFTVGLPYFVLSATGPLLQSWFSRVAQAPSVYRLFSLSNLGSLLALISFPFVFEPALELATQTKFWSFLFIFFAMGCSYITYASRNIQLAAVSQTQFTAVSIERKIQWVLLSTCPSVLMIANTSYLTENVAPIPLLWILPLTLYLLSFIFSFNGRSWYSRKIFAPLLPIALLIMALLPLLGVDQIPLPATLALNLIAYFVICMVCHGELALLQPEVAQLTKYYLYISIGGFIGGLFVGIIAPLLFSENYELSIALIMVANVVTMLYASTNFFTKSIFQEKYILVFGFAFIALLASIRIYDHLGQILIAEWRSRNFYGTLKVISKKEMDAKMLMHGLITHGLQFQSDQFKKQPTGYYIAESGVGKAILRKQSQLPQIRIGVVGLGVGTLAAYGRPTDYFRFYEINPAVIDLAQERFSYLGDTKAQYDLVLGDARLRLAHEHNQFDVLVIDAFSGDSVPVHLLTIEAFTLYFQNLKPDGLLLIHITNRYLNLQKVVEAAAARLHKRVQFEIVDPKDDYSKYRSHWAIVTNEENPKIHDTLADGGFKIGNTQKAWTDSFSSIFHILR